MSGRDHKERIEPFSTVTHARLRLRQGDTAGARRILDTILTLHPDHAGAQELLGEVASRRRAGGGRGPVEGGHAGVQTRRFREALGLPQDQRRAIERLEGWLRRIKRPTGDAHA